MKLQKKDKIKEKLKKTTSLDITAIRSAERIRRSVTSIYLVLQTAKAPNGMRTQPGHLSTHAHCTPRAIQPQNLQHFNGVSK